MKFRQIFSQQTKGCTMGTTKAVDFVNVFTTKSEIQLLKTFKFLLGHRPILLLRIIDDVFLLTEKDQSRV